MNKAYNPIKWVNNETPINETNLNKMSNGLNMVDDRVIALDKTLGGYSDKINEALEASAVAQDAKDIALESAEKAEEALKNAEAVVGVGIATKDKAGLVKVDDVHIENDGTLNYITSTTSATMPNSHKGRLMFEEIGGVSEQGSTAGNQLLDFGNIISVNSTVNVNNNTLTVSGTSAYSLARFIVNNPTAYAGQSLTISCESISKSDSNATITIQLTIVDGDGNTSYFDTISTQTYTIPDNVSIIRVAVYANALNTALTTANTVTVKGLMLNAGDTALPWEPYTGGVASPNPDYPQEIKRVVVSEIKTCGNQLFDGNGTTSTNNASITFSNDTISVTGTDGYASAQYNVPNAENYAGQSLTISCESISKSDSSATITMQLMIVDGDGNTSYFDTISTQTYTIPDNVSIIRVSVYANALNTALTTANTVTVKGLMLNAGDTALPWEPYTESSITLSEPIELCGIGDVQDVIDVEAGVVRRRIKELKITDVGAVAVSEDENWFDSSASYSYELKSFRGKDVNVNINTDLCTHFKAYSYKEFYGKKVVTGFLSSMSYIVVNISKDLGICTTVDEFKQWCTDNDVTFYKELSEEVVTELPTSDRIALNSLATFDGATYLEWDCYLEPTFAGEYGTSKVGGYALEGLLTGRNSEIIAQSNADRLTALEAAVVNNA